MLEVNHRSSREEQALTPTTHSVRPEHALIKPEIGGIVSVTDGDVGDIEKLHAIVAVYCGVVSVASAGGAVYDAVFGEDNAGCGPDNDGCDDNNTCDENNSCDDNNDCQSNSGCDENDACSNNDGCDSGIFGENSGCMDNNTCSDNTTCNDNNGCDDLNCCTNGESVPDNCEP